MAKAVDPRVRRTHDAVAAAASDLLLEQGWAGVTHAAVAERAGYSRMTIYTHWPAPVDLLRAAFEGVKRYPHPERSGDLVPDAIAELRAYRDVLVRGFDRLHTGLAERAHDDPSIAELQRDVSTHAIQPLREILRAGGVERADIVADALAGMVSHRALVRGEHVTDADIEAVVDQLIG